MGIMGYAAIFVVGIIAGMGVSALIAVAVLRVRRLGTYEVEVGRRNPYKRGDRVVVFTVDDPNSRVRARVISTTTTKIRVRPRWWRGEA